MSTGSLQKAIPRLREYFSQVETEVVSNSRNKIHQTWVRPFRGSLYNKILEIFVMSAVCLFSAVFLLFAIPTDMASLIQYKVAGYEKLDI